MDKIMSEKNPAYLMYAKDMLVSTAEMTHSEYGAYNRLLNYQWVNGAINGDPNRHPIGYPNGEWEAIEDKFPLCEDGRRRNPRLESIRQERRLYQEKQSEAGKKGAEKRWGKHGNPNGDPIGNPNGESMALQSSSSSSIPKSNSKKRFDQTAFDRFWAEYPRKVDKQKCLQWWKKHNPDVEMLVTAIEQQKQSQQWEDAQFIPGPYKWLFNARWEDEVTPVEGVWDKVRKIREARENESN